MRPKTCDLEGTGAAPKIASANIVRSATTAAPGQAPGHGAWAVPSGAPERSSVLASRAQQTPIVPELSISAAAHWSVPSESEPARNRSSKHRKAEETDDIFGIVHPFRNGSTLPIKPPLCLRKRNFPQRWNSQGVSTCIRNSADPETCRVRT